MDITLLDTTTVKIKSRNATIIVDPSKDSTKTAADAVIALSDTGSLVLSKAEGARIVIEGTGEYEVSGVKINGFSTPEGNWYTLLADNISVALTKTRTLSQMQDNAKQCQVLLLCVNSDFKDASVTMQEPHMVIFYADKATDAPKTLGKDVQKSKKVSVTAEKIPEEMQVIVLE